MLIDMPVTRFNACFERGGSYADVFYDIGWPIQSVTLGSTAMFRSNLVARNHLRDSLDSRESVPRRRPSILHTLHRCFHSISWSISYQMWRVIRPLSAERFMSPANSAYSIVILLKALYFPYN